MTYIANGLEIPGNDGPQVNDLTRDVHLFLNNLSDLFGNVHLSAPGNNGQIAALLQHLGLRQRYRVVLDGHVLDRLTIENLRLEEYHRIRIANARQEQAFGLHGRARNDHFQTGTVREISLDALRMIQSTVAYSAGRSADREFAAVEQIP